MYVMLAWLWVRLVVLDGIWACYNHSEMITLVMNMIEHEGDVEYIVEIIRNCKINKKIDKYMIKWATLEV